MQRIDEDGPTTRISLGVPYPQRCMISLRPAAVQQNIGQERDTFSWRLGIVNGDTYMPAIWLV